MSDIKLLPFQQRVLEETAGENRVAYYLDMGLGKTFVGSEKMDSIGSGVNVVVCQKSKVKDWLDHLTGHYDDWTVYDGTKPKQLEKFFSESDGRKVLVINYDLTFRRKRLLDLENFTLMLDESSVIQNETAKRSKFILKMCPGAVILLSGTPTGGKYERLWSQLHLLGWEISKKVYWDHYIEYEYIDNQGFSLRVVTGYKNVERLKHKMREHGCVFMKTEEVFDLPEQIHETVGIETSKDYRKFLTSRVIEVDGKELVGETTLTRMLYGRMLCGQYNEAKLQALEDLIQSTDDRLVIFYNFDEELRRIEDVCLKHDRPVGIVNGHEKDLSAFDEYDNGVAIIQYQAGAMGLNLQAANKVIYFTPPLSSELFEQSKKRIHRIGQGRTCFYYYLTCRWSVEVKIYQTLAMRKDYTDALFEEDEKQGVESIEHRRSAELRRSHDD